MPPPRPPPCGVRGDTPPLAPSGKQQQWWQLESTRNHARVVVVGAGTTGANVANGEWGHTTGHRTHHIGRTVLHLPPPSTGCRQQAREKPTHLARRRTWHAVVQQMHTHLATPAAGARSERGSAAQRTCWHSAGRRRHASPRYARNNRTVTSEAASCVSPPPMLPSHCRFPRGSSHCVPTSTTELCCCCGGGGVCRSAADTRRCGEQWPVVVKRRPQWGLEWYPSALTLAASCHHPRTHTPTG